MVSTAREVERSPKLHIRCNVGPTYTIDTNGLITRDDMPEMAASGDWVFLGFSTHHWSTRITIPLLQVFTQLNALYGKKLYGWDRDHGTVRRWGSPQIVRAWVA